MKHYVSIFFFLGGGDVLAWNILLYFILYFLYIFNLIIITSKISISVRGCTETFFMISVEKIKHKITQYIPADIFVNSHYLEKLLQTMIHHWGWKVLLKPLTPKISFSNSLHYLPYSSCDVSLENLVLDKLNNPLIDIYLLGIVLIL